MVGNSIHYDAVGKTAGYEGYRHWSDGLDANVKNFIGLGHAGFTVSSTTYKYMFLHNANANAVVPTTYGYRSTQNSYNTDLFQMDVVVINLTVCNSDSSGRDCRVNIAVHGDASEPSRLYSSSTSTTNTVYHPEQYWVPYGTSLVVHSKNSPLYIPWLNAGTTNGHYLAVSSPDSISLDVTCTYGWIHNSVDTDWTGSGYGA